MPFTSLRTTQLPPVPSIIPTCYSYHTHTFQSPTPHQAKTTQQSNTCESLASKHHISVPELLAWNPSLHRGNCALNPGVGYCVQGSGAVQENRQCVSREALESNVLVSAMVAQCECFIVVERGEKRTCLDIAGEFGVEVEELAQFNNWIGLSCEESLYAGVHEGGSRAVCVSMAGSLTRTHGVSRSTSTGLPICTFDPEKGEYVCPEATGVAGKGLGGDGEAMELK